MQSKIPIISEKYGRLTPISEPYRERAKVNYTRFYWRIKVRCDCAKELIVHVGDLNSGATISCGCFRNEQTGKSLTTHGMSNTKLHHIWCGILSRCKYTNRKDSKYYSQKGITVCDEWKNDFKAFYDWAMSNGWNKYLEVDRIREEGNYEPGNCQCIPHIDNSRKSKNSKLTMEKATEIRKLRKEGKQLKELAKMYGVTSECIQTVVYNKTWM